VWSFLVVEEKGSIYRENLWWKLTSGSVCKSEKSKNKNKKELDVKKINVVMVYTPVPRGIGTLKM
jgi:hypothetical protein